MSRESCVGDDCLAIGMFTANVKYKGKTTPITGIPTIATFAEFKQILQETFSGLKFESSFSNVFYGPRVRHGNKVLEGESAIMSELVKDIDDVNDFVVENAIKFDTTFLSAVVSCICCLLIVYLVTA